MPDPVLQHPSPTQIRDALEEAVIKDLLGPAGGEAEEVDEPSVCDRYLVGLLAPRRQLIEPEQQDDLAVGGGGTPEDGSTDVGAPQARTMFPSSFGLTFCVDSATKELSITARWGRYEKVKSETAETDAGNPKTVWKRRQIEGTLAITLGEGTWTQAPSTEFPDVTVQAHARRPEDHWIVTLFLVNGQEEQKPNRDRFWLFQPELIVTAPDDEAVFVRRTTRRDGAHMDAEDRAMAMIYRRHVEFAVGHGVSVHAEAAPAGERARKIATRVVPAADVLSVTAPTPADVPTLAQVVVDMRELAETADDAFAGKLGPLASAYREWIERESARITDAASALAGYDDVAREAMDRCRESLARIEAGITLLGASSQAAEAFRFLNRAMWQQRIHSLHAERIRRRDDVSLETLDVPANRSWYPFQLAFILLNLPGLSDLHHPERADDQTATADLLWFPTGGGKTEAYLGLTAYTLALRRLQGPVAGRSGEHGIAVLMRYTLRLLTLQQFQRAAALLCACETIRRQARDAGDDRWGETPFRIGLWVGQRTTPNTTEQSAESVRQAHGAGRRATAAAGVGSPRQLTNCPWCGSSIEPGRHIRVEPRTSGRGRTITYCGEPLGQCPFSERQAPGEGLPVVVVDEEIYRLLPAVLVATVDKFAQMPWNGATQMLFGQVDGFCGRHGFRSPEIEDENQHRARAPLPAARTVPANPVRPPDLIIQDELHLISGPLGTLVGLYETAVDRLASWEVGGRTVRPKVIASTATVRRAPDQVHAVFVRRVRVFPPPGLDVADNFFSRQRPRSEAHPGRRYLGICAPGRRQKAALIRVYVAFLAAAQQLYERYGRAADPWMTLVGYFNSMRELGGMRRLVDDDVRTRLARIDRRGLAVRAISYDGVEELTSRKGGTDIPEVLDALEAVFAPGLDARRREMLRRGQPHAAPARPLDVLLATNMLSVGVDVRRLGLMVVAGQPKTTAEYIQATSRVGRASFGPGLVCTVLNWVRPRDLSHYERFEHYHATFYQQVEALSVTPFAPRAIDRGLTPLLVALIRLAGTEFNENLRAGRIDRFHPYVRTAVEQIARRAHLVGSGAAVEQLVRAELEQRLDDWLAEAQRQTGGRRLGYREERDGLTAPLLHRPGRRPWDDFTCLNSLRDVEPEVGLVLDDRGLDEESAATPVAPAGDDDDTGAGP